MDTDHHNLYVAKSTNSYTLPEIPTSGDLKSGDSISCTNPLPKCPQNPPPPHPTPPHKLTQLSGKWFRTLYELLHEVHTIKICIHHCNDEIAFVLNTCENAPEKKKWAEVQSKAQKYSPVDLFREIW